MYRRVELKLKLRTAYSVKIQPNRFLEYFIFLEWRPLCVRLNKGTVGNPITALCEY